jgi:hypothetical protein
MFALVYKCRQQRSMKCFMFALSQPLLVFLTKYSMKCLWINLPYQFKPLYFKQQPWLTYIWCSVKPVQRTGRRLVSDKSQGLIWSNTWSNNIWQNLDTQPILFIKLILIHHKIWVTSGPHIHGCIHYNLIKDYNTSMA